MWFPPKSTHEVAKTKLLPFKPTLTWHLINLPYLSSGQQNQGADYWIWENKSHVVAAHPITTLRAGIVRLG